MRVTEFQPLSALRSRTLKGVPFAIVLVAPTNDSRIGGSGSRRAGGPAKTAGHCMALRESADEFRQRCLHDKAQPVGCRRMPVVVEEQGGGAPAARPSTARTVFKVMATLTVQPLTLAARNAGQACCRIAPYTDAFGFLPAHPRMARRFPPAGLRARSLPVEQAAHRSASSPQPCQWKFQLTRTSSYTCPVARGNHRLFAF